MGDFPTKRWRKVSQALSDLYKLWYLGHLRSEEATMTKEVREAINTLMLAYNKWLA